MGVFIVSFAATTLDTATRIQRYVVSELGKVCKMEPITGKHAATAIAVIFALILAFHDKTGKGALTLWPLFGATNQLLAGLTLFVITIYLAKKRKNIHVTLVPMFSMLFMTGWAMALQFVRFYDDILKNIEKNEPFIQHAQLLGIGVVIIILEIWMIVESYIVFRNTYSNQNGLESDQRTGDSE
jgi:carbon starvation protein